MKKKIKLWFRIYRMVWSFHPGHLIYLSILGLIQGISVVFQMLTIQLFVDHIQKNSFAFKNAVIYLMGIGGVLVIRRLYNAFFNYNINKHIHWAQDVIKLSYIKEASKISLAEFYEPEFETKKNMACQGAQSASYFLNIGLMLLSFNIPYFIFIGIYYSFFTSALPFILLLIIFPSFYAVSKNMREYKELEDSISNNRKKMNYYYQCVGDMVYLKETKILKAGNYFFNKINEESDEYRDLVFKHTKLILKNCLAGELAKYLGYVLIFFILIAAAFKDIISIGLLIAIISSLNDMYSVFNDMVDRDFKALSSFYYEVENYLNFFNSDLVNPYSCKSQMLNNKMQDIELESVSYCYPGRQEYAIKDFHFKFIRGKTYAVVGENGAGKTTLSRLILGLLPASAGTISIYGNTDDTGCRSAASALFQNHARYPFSLRENVMLSDTLSPPSDDKIISLLEKCGISARDNTLFPCLLDTVLSREFNGTELSGGQWQRVSLARCIYRKHDMLLLDEPTSAIDPMNETALFKLFQELSQDKTSIIITHRLGVVSIADYILVLDHGKLIEFGTHEELINRGGKYKEMYLAQSRNYF